MKVAQINCFPGGRVSTSRVSMGNCSKRLIAAALVPILWFCLTVQTRAQITNDGATITTKDLGSGALQITYFSERGGGDAQGYLHVNVSTVKGVSPRERVLEIVFYAHSGEWPAQLSVAYHVPVRLGEGSRSVDMAHPFFIANAESDYNTLRPLYWDVTVREDGRDIELTRTFSGRGISPARASFSVKVGTSNVYHSTNQFNSARNMLRLIDDSATALSAQPQLARLLTAQDGSDPSSAQAASNLGQMEFGVSYDPSRSCSVRALSTAPDRWQYYLQFKLVVMDRAGLEKLVNTRKSVASAIRQYIAAGGCFILIGDEQLSGRRLVDQWLLQTDAPASDDEVGWQPVHAQMFAWWSLENDPLMPAFVIEDGSGAAARPLVPQPALPPGPRVVQNRREGQGRTMAATPNSQTARQSMNLKPKTSSSVLSLGGCARDCLVALESLAMAEYGNVFDVSQEFGDVLSDDGSSAMGMGGASAGIASLTNVEVFGEWINTLERQVTSFESRQNPGCAVREHVLGRVAVVEPGLDSVPMDQLRATLQELSYSASLGANSWNDGSWSWRNLIQSVGKPPVMMFCAIVVLFGSLLGPGLLVMTGWLRRRSLLIFLVPFVSLVATLLIVAYAVVHEGFGTSIRITSVFAVDERSGDGFAWSRQTYFSGWPPREGLNIPNHVYYRPVAPSMSFDQYREQTIVEPRRGVRSHVLVGDSQSRWVGWLRSREQQQLLIGHPAKVEVPIKIRPLRSKRVVVQNVCGERLPFVLLRDGGDGYFLTGPLEAGAEEECGRQSIDDVAGAIARYRVEHSATLPEGLSGMRTWSRGRYSGVLIPDTSSGEALDHVWNGYLSEDVSMPKRSFVTVVQKSDTVVVPLAGKITESKHLVVGRLIW